MQYYKVEKQVRDTFKYTYITLSMCTTNCTQTEDKVDVLLQSGVSINFYAGSWFELSN